MLIFPNHPNIAVAPMVDVTDRHCRYLLRLLNPKVQLYTEMITAQAIINGDQDYLLAFDASEHPLTLQLGGSDPELLSQAASIASRYHYDAINLNVGCPSDRVQSGRFGACLMAEPELVAESVQALQAATQLPVSVKTRIGIDAQDSYAFFENFIQTVANANCDTFIVHARKAWLQGLSPKQNREIPPLRYDMVVRLKQQNPKLNIVLNGGINSVSEISNHLQTFDGVMLGRSPYQNLYLLAEIAAKFYNVEPLSRVEVTERYLDYMSAAIAKGVPFKAMSRHLIGLYQGLPGARAWRRALSVSQNLTDFLSLRSELHASCYR